MSPIELVISRLCERDCKPGHSNSRPGQWHARCPAHGDKRPSLSVGTGDDGRVLLRCHKGCTCNAVLAALSLRSSDLYPRDQQGRRLSKVRYDDFWQAVDAVAKSLKGECVATYHYVHADGFEAFVVARYRTSMGKEIRPFCRNRNGRWKVKAPGKNRPLYRLRELIRANRVVVVEGEKCADLVRDRHGLVATTSAFGAQNPDRTDWSPLAGKIVTIVPDCDAAGRAYARDVARLLSNLTPAPTVKIVYLPGLEEGEDIEQWLDLQPLDWTRDQIREAFEKLVAAAAGLPRYDKLPTKEQQAIDLIREMLAGGMVPSQELEDRIIASGIGQRTYDRARRLAGVKSKQISRRHYSALDVEPMGTTASKGNASKSTQRKARRKAQDAKLESPQDAKDVPSGRQPKSRSSGRQDAIQDAKPSNYVEEGILPVLGEHRNLSEAEDGLEFHTAESNPDLPPETELTLEPTLGPEAVPAIEPEAEPAAELVPTSWEAIADRRIDWLIQGIEDGSLTEEKLGTALPVLRKANGSFEAKVSRLKDSRKTNRKVLARLESEALHETLEWATRTKPAYNAADDYEDVKLLGFLDWRDVRDLIRSRATTGKPDHNVNNPPAETLALSTDLAQVAKPVVGDSEPVPDPAAPLYELLRNYRDPADCPVMTPGGPGILRQVFSSRVGVVLNTDPRRVAYFHPSQITVPLAKDG